MGGSQSRSSPAPAPASSPAVQVISTSAAADSASAAAASASAASTSANAASTSANAASISASAAARSASEASRSASDASGTNVASEEVLQERSNTRERIKEHIFGNTDPNTMSDQQKNNVVRILASPNYITLRSSLDLALANYQNYFTYYEIIRYGNEWINSNTPHIPYNITNRVYDHLASVTTIMNRPSNTYIRRYIYQIGANTTDYPTVSIRFFTNYIMTHPETVTPEETATAFLNYLVTYYNIPPETEETRVLPETTTPETFTNYFNKIDYSKISVDNGLSLRNSKLSGHPFSSKA